jgi:hypothetical protein
MAATPVQGKLLALEAKIVNDAAGDWLANVAAIKRDLAIESPDVRRRLFELVTPYSTPSPSVANRRLRPSAKITRTTSAPRARRRARHLGRSMP